MRMETKQIRKKVFMGTVVSDRMNKTITVLVSRRQLHPLYKKYITSSKKYKAHDESNSAHVGDAVSIIESRPMSKEKRWRLLEIIERAK